MALKREETARKRRNLTEKKLEDEKVRHRGSYVLNHANFHLLYIGRNYQPSTQETVPLESETQCFGYR